MTRRRRRTGRPGTRTLLLALLVAACGGCTPQPSSCAVEPVGTLPLFDAAGFLVVPVSLGDEPAAMLVDTGAQGSLIDPAVATRLALPTDPGHMTNIIGVGGASVRVANVVAPSITLGNVTTGPVSLPLRALPGQLDRLNPPVAGLLGLNVLGGMDLDIDRPQHRVTVTRRVGCAETGPPWRFAHDRLPLRRTPAGFLLVPVQVDGVALEAMIDTGARTSVLSEAAVARLRGADAAVADGPAMRSLGVDAVAMQGHRHRFATLQIGSVVIRDLPLVVSAIRPPAGDMLLGDDVLRAHRFWLSLPGGVAWIARDGSPE